jgi:hypothetical protein
VSENVEKRFETDVYYYYRSLVPMVGEMLKNVNYDYV